MRSHSRNFNLKDPELFRKKALAWASTFSHCSYFNPNGINSYPYGPFEEILAVGALEIFNETGHDDFTRLKEFYNTHQDWLIGFLGYDLKNQVENLTSKNTEVMTCPDMGFYIPQHLILFKGDRVKIESTLGVNQIFNQIEHCQTVSPIDKNAVKLKPSTSRDNYIHTVNRLKQHILEGDIYEINYCVAFTANEVEIHPLSIYHHLMKISPTPFSVFHKFDSQYLICASPERFIKKHGKKLISQPIKGTARRGASDHEDELIKQQLRTDEKELAENMMIVDLVRNDLARTSKSGSVKVDEMFGVYTFRQLHQMISTVTSELRDDVHFIDAIRHAFPMGSMTGAPKIKVMQLIEQYENTKRGLYSGAMGYITPEGNFDFNVVIRSLLYNKETQQLSFQVGSAITYDAQAEQEYDECLLKASALIAVLGAEVTD